ncbi:MAG: lipid-A-disaccharide synthase [Calditrichia bacterium]
MMPEQKRKILIIAGEPSGDRHAAELVYELKKYAPGIAYEGIGGDDMAEQGVKLLYHIRQMAFLGFAEVIRHLPFIRSVFRHLRKWMAAEKPLALILVDYPGFNLRLARIAGEFGVPVIYYICPQLWAWGEKRVEKIRRYVDLPLVIFKFEEEFYARHGIPAKFVGHPLADEIHISLSEAEFREKHKLDPDKPIVALLPGSRNNEVRKLLPMMIRTATEFRKSHEVQFIVGKASSVDREVYHIILKNTNSAAIIEKDIHHLMKYSYASLVASGTATLESGYLGTPMVVLYRVAPLTYHIGRMLIKIENIALANIVSGKTVVPELIQGQLTVPNIVNALDKYFSDAVYYDNVMGELQKIKAALGPPGAADRAAREIARFLEDKYQLALSGNSALPDK